LLDDEALVLVEALEVDFEVACKGERKRMENVSWVIRQKSGLTLRRN